MLAKGQNDVTMPFNLLQRAVGLSLKLLKYGVRRKHVRKNGHILRSEHLPRTTQPMPPIRNNMHFGCSLLCLDKVTLLKQKSEHFGRKDVQKFVSCMSLNEQRQQQHHHHINTHLGGGGWR
jgi:hypothetical protein